ncbi:lytic transglycosylase domain-containing protein [Nocardioides sp. W3-2-3]|uniref:hypothetical protein n=1 Tax=Nocardioides convexus TaxID=2712224 RepID=UPI002418822E|nr:hypothetical protein [Nocardioides convexus]NGZ99475.1 lytic transglycosylase domain-containing protein [Nocardioides convexus]
MGVTTGSAARWVRRGLGLLVLASVLAVVLATTGILNQGDRPAPAATSADAALPVAPPSVAPEVVAPAQVPAAVPAPLPVQAVAVRRAPVAAAYPGALLDAPPAAVAAYQRAATIIDSAADCNLDWLVLAALGRIESDHGRGTDGRHRVSEEGLVRPALVGAPQNGRGGRSRVDDTDGGALDRNRRWDAAVGPLGLLPATWATVAVDADGDGVRDPQDLDDATLAASVLLCAGGHDLGKPAALRAALTSYHRTKGFAAAVLALVTRYDTEPDRRTAGGADGEHPAGGPDRPVRLRGRGERPAAPRQGRRTTRGRRGASAPHAGGRGLLGPAAEADDAAEADAADPADITAGARPDARPDT